MQALSTGGVVLSTEIVVKCPKCGADLKVDRSAAGQEGECPDCGQAIKIPAAEQKPLVTIAAPRQPPVPPTSAPVTASAPAAKTMCGLAVASLVMGILAVIPGAVCGGPLFAILGIVFSCVAQSKIKRSGGLLEGRGLAVAGLVTSIVGLALCLLIMLIFGVAFGSMAAAFSAFQKSAGPH